MMRFLSGVRAVTGCGLRCRLLGAGDDGAQGDGEEDRAEDEDEGD
jgi:hypothetical protein